VTPVVAVVGDEEEESKQQQQPQKTTTAAAAAATVATRRTKTTMMTKKVAKLSILYAAKDEDPVPAAAFLKAHPAATVPGTLTLLLDVPSVASAREIDIDVSAHDLVLQFEGEAHRAQHIELPFTVQEDAARVRFDKKRRQLRVTLPVASTEQKEKKTTQQKKPTEAKEQQQQQQQPSTKDWRAALPLSSPLIFELCDTESLI
jgi:hypothetical protein